MDPSQQGQMSMDQLQQMQAMLSMMGSGSAGAAMPPVNDPGMLGMPGVDPNMAQAYLTMLQYLSAQQTLGAGGMGGMGMPPMPFPGMPSPYAPAVPAAAEPTISVAVDGMKFQYQLTEDDLHKVFTRYGGIKNIRVDTAGAAAQITFHNFNDAQSAMSDLNGKVLNGLDGTLRINWVSQGQASLPPPYPGVGMGFPPSLPGWPPASGLAPGGGAPTGGDAKTAHTKGVRKYTCRFIVGIENDKEFQVARRIIGAKGSNMKRIVKNTDAKLRLRGVGSGYFEGAGQKESSEPLQLCISCTDGEHYKTAVQQTEDLLRRVYEEYNQFCRDNGEAAPNLQVNVSENQLVYSASRSGAMLGGVQDGMPLAGQDDSPGKGRSRRSRNKGNTKTATGEDERGEPGPNAPSVEEIEKMIDMRNEARRACNFAEADRLRDALHSSGVALMDEPGGRGKGAEVTTWRYWRE